MKKSINVLALTTAITGICAGAAMAAQISNTGTIDAGTGAITIETAVPRTIAAERFSATGLTVPHDTEIFYRSTANFVANDVITFTFNNVAFTDAAFALCDPTNVAGPTQPVADYIGNIDTTNGVSTLVFRANGAIPNTDTLYIAEACDAIPYSATDEAGAFTSKLTPKFPQLSSGSAATVSAAAVFGTGTSIPGATAAATSIYTVANEFSMTTPAVTSAVIDFSTALTTFSNGLTKITGAALTLADTTPDVPVTLAAGDTLNLTVTGSMAGVSRICFNDTTCAADSANKLTINTTTNTATKNVDISAGVASVTGKALTFVFDGTTGLSARTYKLKAVLNFTATTETGRTLLNDVDYLSLTLNSTQYYVPLVKFNSVSDTFIKLQSKNTSTGTNGVSVQCLATDGSMVTVTPSPASITPGTAYTLQGSQLAAAVAAAGKAVDPNGFAAIITINTPNSDTFAYAKLVDPNGTTRVPVKTVYAAGAAQIVE